MPHLPERRTPIVSRVTQTADVAIRRAADGDWSQIWPIFREVTVAGDTFAYDPQTDEATARSWWLAPPPNQTWLALDGETVLGCYILGPNHGGPGAHIANASYMVGGSVRGRGIGRRLVEHSLEQARAAGYVGVQFNAVAASNVYAIKLYQDLGFETIGTVPAGFRHPEQGLVDLLVMYQPV
jgi:ribosomal protein S18 acetylase RimI-like enzyme